MTFRGYFPLLSKIRQIFSGSWRLMSKIKLNETYIFKISIKMRFFWWNYWYQNSIFSSFGPYWGGSLLPAVRYHELFDNNCHGLCRDILVTSSKLYFHSLVKLRWQEEQWYNAKIILFITDARSRAYNYRFHM